MKPTRKMYECAAELIEKQPRLAHGVWREVDQYDVYGCCCIGGAVMACSTKIYFMGQETKEALRPLFMAPVPGAYEKFTDWNDHAATVAEAAQFLRDIAKTLPEA